MKSDLSSRPINVGAFGERPFTFLTPAVQEDLSNIAAIELIENGDRVARETWQKRQLTNLLRHAHTQSRFWRQRMPSRVISNAILGYLPVQSREDVAAQVNAEGSLVKSDGRAPVSSYASTGSTGTPVKVFCSPQNGYYNIVRYMAQFFVDKLSFDEPRVMIGPPTNVAMLEKNSIIVKTTEAWAGPLSRVFRNGPDKQINHLYDDDALVAELLKDRVGYLVCHSRIVEILLRKGGVELFNKLGVKLWFHISDYRDPDAVKTLAEIGVPSLSNYSAGEMGPIAFECRKAPGFYHVAHSNVVVELDDKLTTSFNGVSVGRLLITHLHSYATPLIRYDIGDFAQLDERCPCGHDGPTISNIFGRGKHFLRHPSGSLVPFYLSTRATIGVVPGFTEFRVRQTEVETIDVEVGGRETITPEEENDLTKLISAATDPAFKVRIKPVTKIDWSRNPKRLLFSSSVA